MDVGQAWTLLTHKDSGVRTGNTQCFIANDMFVECHVDGNEQVVTLNHSEFLLTFNTNTFTEIQAQDV